MKLEGWLSIIDTIFSHCSTNAIGGALSCIILNMEMSRACYNDCCSLCKASAASGNDVFHAIKVFGVVSENYVKIEQCGYALCPKEVLFSDEAIGIFYNCIISFNDNNCTDDKLGRAEMITFYRDLSIKDPMIHCNLKSCMSSRIICSTSEIVIEKCNIIENNLGNAFEELFHNQAKLTIAKCVIAFNEHRLLCNSEISIISSCFCNNKFTHGGEELCIKTLVLYLAGAESCKRRTFHFTKETERSLLRVIMWIFLLLE